MEERDKREIPDGLSPEVVDEWAIQRNVKFPTYADLFAHEIGGVPLRMPTTSVSTTDPRRLAYEFRKGSVSFIKHSWWLVPLGFVAGIAIASAIPQHNPHVIDQPTPTSSNASTNGQRDRQWVPTQSPNTEIEGTRSLSSSDALHSRTSSLSAPTDIPSRIPGDSLGTSR